MKVKRTIAILVLLVLLCSASAYAATTAVGKPSLSFSGTTASCSITVTQSGKPIDVTLELYQGSTLVDSWSKSGTSRVKVSGSASVTSGLSYRLEAYGTINGVPFTATPVTRTCP
jgi:type 1 fimbria pilin